ncbi:cytochrome C [Azospirillum sp. TSO22-1]|uniref:c-type cytochrome n=1 Tax=Azospirillum sp. TSO22-1 TaxID=716789 RepID=UPI000D61D03E|nr:cytochrome C [Azospirillum sp. TSO22-1]PWC41400.1 cytochrome C [Azospirillum sp. TSO22-1]
MTTRIPHALAVLATLAFAHAAAAETPLERGAYLINSIVACGNCHTPQGPDGPVPGMELAGGLRIEEAPFTAYTANLTPDPATGIGRWSDAEIVTAIREGRRPDGTLIGPPMPFHFYRGMSDGDAMAIVAYLRQVKPVVNPVPKSEFRMPLPVSWGPPVGSVPDVPRSDAAKYAEYVTGPLGHCMDCHTPRLSDGRLDMTRWGAGGLPLNGPWGVSVSRNVTADPDDGLGKWTDAQIKAAITSGVRPDGARLAPPMAYHYYRNIRDEDLTALVAYLRTLPPLKGPVAMGASK